MLRWEYDEPEWLLLDDAEGLECLATVQQLTRRIEGFCYVCGWKPADTNLPAARNDLIHHAMHVHERGTMKRICTTCSLQNPPKLVPATHVATDPSKMQWYECGQHEEFEHAETLGERNDPMSIRCALVPLEVWLKQIGVDE